MEVKDKNVIITGAGGGIGSQIALAFGRRGARLSLVERRREYLNSILKECKDEGIKAIGLAGDITSEEDIRKVIDEAVKGLGPIDILVNNAGVMVFRSIENHTRDDVLNTIMVNIYGPIRLTQAVLSGMLKRNCGRIVNIGSIFGSLSFPFFSIYSASKWAIRGFSEALRRELQDTGVGVTYIAPRATRTSQSQKFFEMARRTGMNLDQPEKVAAIVVDATLRGLDEVYIGMPERFFVFVNKTLPYIVDRALKKKMSVMAEYIT